MLTSSLLPENTMNLNKVRGMRAEIFACDYLKRQGLTLRESNFSCRCGEIDLIMEDGNYFVFIEVRLRNARDHHSGADSVDHVKQGKLIKTAQRYLQIHQCVYTRACRFDVVDLYQTNNGYHVDWIKNAFTC